MTRHNDFTPKTKRLARERSGGTCEVHLIPSAMRLVRYPALPLMCGRPIKDVDHIHAAVFDGSRDLSNAACLCGICHPIKTVTDNKEAKKSRRLRGDTGNGPKREIPQPKTAWPKGRKLQSRGFR